MGTGKTTIINALLNNLDDDVIAAHVPDPGLEDLDFFNFIANVFSINEKISTKGDFLKHLSKFLHDAYSKNKKVLLIIDEAQRLKPELLEEIRLLSNIEKQDTKLLNIFFVGQKEFNNILIEPENRALRQRITINYYIEPLTEDETKECVNYRLNVAGSKRNIFSSSAIREIFSFSKGFPRLINIICDLALVTGYVKEQKTINANIIRECAKELQIPTEKVIEDDKEKQEIPPKESQIAEDDSKQEVEKGGLKSAAKVAGCFFLLVGFLIVTWHIINYPAEFKITLSNINKYMTQLIGNITNSKSERLLQSSPTTINSNPVVQKYSINQTDSEPEQNKQVQISKEQNESLEDKNISGKTSNLIAQSEKEDFSTTELTKTNNISIAPTQIPDKNIIIYFRYNTNELSENALIELDKVSEIMTQNPDADIIIKGYTDTLG
ncbi:MAG: AAA family ATPase, partial [Desulfobacterales bacterium]|nr:AAA family ATPase [Desulfobacterales bacterium]